MAKRSDWIAAAVPQTGERMRRSRRPRVSIRDKQHSGGDAVFKYSLELRRLVGVWSEFGISILDRKLVICSDAGGVRIRQIELAILYLNLRRRIIHHGRAA